MNNYPEGKMNENDEGAVATMIYIDSKKVVIEFGKPLGWIAFGKEGLRAFINVLESKYEKL